MMPSPTAMFAFDLQSQHNPTANQANQTANRYVTSERYYVQDQDGGTNGPMYNDKPLECDPSLQSPRSFLQTQSQELQPPQKVNKGFLTLLPPSYSNMATPAASSIDTVSTKVRESHSDDPDLAASQQSASVTWQQTHNLPQSYSHDQSHSAPVLADHSLQTFQAQSSRMYHSAIPPATAPLTINAHSGFPHFVSYVPPMHPQTPGPLQMQQSMYSTDAPSNGANSSSSPAQWFHVQPPATAPPAMRPSLQHFQSFPNVPTSAMYSPVAVQTGSGVASGSRQRSFAEQQQQFNVTALHQQIPGASAAPMMLMESVRPLVLPGIYDPALVDQSSTAVFNDGKRSRADGASSQPRAEDEAFDDDESDEALPTPKEVITYSEQHVDRRSLRFRKSAASAATKAFAHGEGEDEEKQTEKDRPRKKSKRQDRSAEEAEDIVAVRANGKGNQFILTLYAMVEAPSSYPLIGWNLPGTAIVIPDSKAFATAMLNKYFRHSTISSFARQLVSYGFLKTELPARERALVHNAVRSDSKHWTFSHDFFLRGRADLLDQVVPLVSPSRPQKPPAKRSQAAMRHEEEAFMDVLKRENTHWRERCERLEQCMLEEKARANQYLSILMERGIIPGGAAFPAPHGLPMMMASPAPPQQMHHAPQPVRMEEVLKREGSVLVAVQPDQRPDESSRRPQDILEDVEENGEMQLSA